MRRVGNNVHELPSSANEIRGVQITRENGKRKSEKTLDGQELRLSGGAGVLCGGFGGLEKRSRGKKKSGPTAGTRGKLEGSPRSAISFQGIDRGANPEQRKKLVDVTQDRLRFRASRSRR